LVYPAHGAGSMCGKNLSTETVSTMGEQKRHNYALQPMSLEEFRHLVTSEQPEAPDYFVYDAIKNRQERPDLEATLSTSLNGLSVSDVLRLRTQGAQLIDVRSATDFAGAHLAGSINIGLQGQYATWCGSMLSHDRAIVVIADPGSEEEAVMRLGRIGFDNVAGYLEGGMAGLLPYPELIETTSRITAPTLAEQMTTTPSPFVVDVRSEREWSAGHLACSHNIPLPHLRAQIDAIPKDRPVVVHCEGGYRSAIGTSLLMAAGRTNVSDLVGGIKAWIAHQNPVESNSAATSSCRLPSAK